jgi:recombination protein RecA
MEQSVIKSLLKTVNKDFGDGAAQLLREREEIDAISTGSIPIDYIIGPKCRGWPLGKISQVYGGEKAGKSMLMCHTIREAQQLGLPVFLVDRENHYTADWVERFGAKTEDIIDLWPQSIEQTFGMLNECVTAMETAEQEGGLFIIDSLQSLLPQVVYENDTSYSEGIASAARYLSSRLGMHVDRIWSVKLAVIIVGQIRIDPTPYGRDYTPGGKALEHFSVLRLRMKFKGEIMEKDPITKDEDRIGFISEVSTDKNNVGGKPSGQHIKVEFSDWGKCDDTAGLLKIASQLKLIETSGAGWYKSDELGLKFRGVEEWRT